MKTKSMLWLNPIVGILVIGITFIIFFLGLGGMVKTGLDYAALLFVVLSEILLFLGMGFVMRDRVFMSKTVIRSGMITLLWFYFLVTVAFSSLSHLLFQDHVALFITAQLVILVLSAIIAILIFMAATKVKAADEKNISAKAILEKCDRMVYVLKADPAFIGYASLFSMLDDELRYCDRTVVSEIEDLNIYEKIEKLVDDLKNMHSGTDQADKDTVESMVNEILVLIKERNQHALQMKRGGY